MYKFFLTKHKEEIENAMTLEDCINIKEQLRVMPMCANKVLLFKKIIDRERIICTLNM